MGDVCHYCSTDVLVVGLEKVNRGGRFGLPASLPPRFRGFGESAGQTLDLHQPAAALLNDLRQT